MEKLDRAMCNDAWRMELPYAQVKVLTRVEFFDHHPIMIMLAPGDHNRVARKFKLESVWLMDDTYQDMLKKVWRNEHNLNVNLKHVRKTLESGK